MKTALDTNVIAAVLCLETGNQGLIRLLGELSLEGALVISGAAYSEAHAIPEIDLAELEEFLLETGIAVEHQVTLEDWAAVGKVLNQQVTRAASKLPPVGTTLFLSDALVGCHASRHADRLLTLEPSRYETSFSKLRLVDLEAVHDG